MMLAGDLWKVSKYLPNWKEHPLRSIVPSKNHQGVAPETKKKAPQSFTNLSLPIDGGQPSP